MSKPRRMFVWSPQMLADYTDGLLCVIATSKEIAIAMALKELYPKQKPDAPAHSRAWFDSMRAQLRGELEKEEPQVIARGVAYVRGGG